MEWTPARIRVLRSAGLCLSQDEFATALGFAKRTVGNAERGVHPPSLAPTLDGLRGAVLGRPLTARMDLSESSAPEMAAIAQVHRRYQLADYDSAAQLLPAVLMRLHGHPGAPEGDDEGRFGTLTSRHIALAARAGLLQ